MRFPALLSLGLMLLAGCAAAVPRADYSPAAAIPADAAPAPVIFNGAELLLPVGAEIGFESDSARFCGWPRHPVSRAALRDVVDTKFLGQTFHDALGAQGYDVVGGLDLAFDLEEEAERAEYAVAAKITSVNLDLCRKDADTFLFFFATHPGTQGEFFMTVDWTVYDVLRRNVVYKATTQGYAKRGQPNQEGLALMFSDAFEMAAHNLGADRKFSDLLVSGIAPELQKQAGGEIRPRRFDPREEVVVPAAPLSRKPFTKDIDKKRGVAVMLQKLGHGTGFFITHEGHILTSAHVVGDSLRMRVVTANNERELVAEVLRVDRPRDVALLKLEEIPQGLEIITLPLRRDWPGVGEDVYVIGVPHDARKLQDTVTKGIISAHRRDMKFAGAKQDYLQADVELHPGSSGGPLIDENGNIVGLAAAGYVAPGAAGMGLNYFVPIGEALAVLNIKTAP